MRRLIALLVALVFAAGLATAPVVLAQTAKTPKADADKAATIEKGASKSKLDVNTASESELRELPGVGDAYAKRIVENRPYKRKDELVRKGVVPQATYDKIKDQIIAHQVKDTTGKAPAAGGAAGKKK